MKKLLLLTVLFFTFNTIVVSQSSNELRKDVANYYTTKIGDNFPCLQKVVTRYNGDIFSSVDMRLDSVKAYTVKRVENSPDGGSYIHPSHMITTNTTSVVFHVDDIYFSIMIGKEREVFTLTWEHENGIGDYVKQYGIKALDVANYQIDFDAHKVYIPEVVNP